MAEQKQKKQFGKTQAKPGLTTKQNDKPVKELKPGNAEGKGA